MQPSPDNKSAPKPKRPRAKGTEPKAGYLLRCGCKTLVNVPITGETVRCQGCGMRLAWQPERPR